MMIGASWKVSVSANGGLHVSEGRSLEVEAFDVINVKVPGGTSTAPGTLSVEVQPADASERVRLLLIRSSIYGEAPTPSALKFSVTGGAADIALDQPQLFVGEGAVGLLGAPPMTMTFENALGAEKDAIVTIIVGRDATP